MKKLILFISFLSLSISVLAKDLEAYVLYDKDGKKTDIGKVLKSTEGKRFIFFGELHDNPISHWLQFEITKRLYAMYKTKLMLGAEMFEADNQYILDEYLAGKISASNFQEEVRLWPNYNTDYKPLVEFAKSKRLKFIATNIPRRYASICYKKGLDSLLSLSDLAKTYIVPLDQFEFDSTVTCYRKMITDFGDHGGVQIATAQALKDATMAYFILKNVENRNIFMHYNGNYHSDNQEGIIYYLKKEVDVSKILTLSTVLQENTDKLSDKYIGTADFIICVPETMTTTH
jgi:uncharacterized iron-regulated protein